MKNLTANIFLTVVVLHGFVTLGEGGRYVRLGCRSNCLLVFLRGWLQDRVNQKEDASSRNAGMWQGEFMKPWEWRKR